MNLHKHQLYLLESFKIWSAIIRINTLWGWILDYEIGPW